MFIQFIRLNWKIVFMINIHSIVFLIVINFTTDL